MATPHESNQDLGISLWVSVIRDQLKKEELQQ